MRKAEVIRTTFETDISLSLDLDGSGIANIETGIGFLNHMLISFAKHGSFDLSIQCKGDIEVDDHHSTEDIGIVLGQAFGKCIENKLGLKRFATEYVPMDEALVSTSVDLSGRAFFVDNFTIPSPKVGEFDTELVVEFLRAFAYNAKITLHVNMLYGKNSHHIMEAIFKSLGRALNEASKIEGETLLSTKGSL